MLNGLDGGFELAHSLPVACQKRYGKGTYLFRDLCLQYAESCLASRSDKHTQAACKVVTNDICDGMCLSGAGRPLNRHASGLSKALNNSYLFVVIR